jgi:hypothetical protein
MAGVTNFILSKLTVVEMTFLQTPPVNITTVHYIFCFCFDRHVN